MNHLGCPQFYLDQLHSLYGFFIPIFFSIIFVVTFVINVGYIVEERENKTKVTSHFSTPLPHTRLSLLIGIFTHLRSSYLDQQLSLGHKSNVHLFHAHWSHDCTQFSSST